MNTLRFNRLASGIISLLLYSTSSFSAGMSISMDLDVVSSPCTVLDQTLKVKIEPVSKYYLYKYGSSDDVNFAIKLSDCDPSISSSAQITFSGPEESKFPGKLSVDKSSQAQGIALGLYNATDEFLQINNNATRFQLTKGQNEFLFKVKVFGIPANIENKDIQAGSFSASAVALITYS